MRGGREVAGYRIQPYDQHWLLKLMESELNGHMWFRMAKSFTAVAMWRDTVRVLGPSELREHPGYRYLDGLLTSGDKDGLESEPFGKRKSPQRYKDLKDLLNRMGPYIGPRTESERIGAVEELYGARGFWFDILPLVEQSRCVGEGEYHMADSISKSLQKAARGGAECLSRIGILDTLKQTDTDVVIRYGNSAWLLYVAAPIPHSAGRHGLIDISAMHTIGNLEYDPLSAGEFFRGCNEAVVHSDRVTGTRSIEEIQRCVEIVAQEIATNGMVYTADPF